MRSYLVIVFDDGPDGAELVDQVAPEHLKEAVKSCH